MPQRCVGLVVLLGCLFGFLNYLATAADPPKAKPNPQHEALARQLKSPAELDRFRALTAIGQLGEEGAPLARALCELIADPSATRTTGLMAASTLRKIRPELYQPVMSLRFAREMGKEGGDPQGDGVKQLSGLGKDAEPTLPILIALTKETLAAKSTAADKQALLRDLVGSLAAIGAEDALVVKFLFDNAAATNKDATLRGHAIKGVAVVGAGRKDLRDKAVALVKTGLETAAVRPPAIEAAALMRTNGKALVPVLKKLADAGDAAAKDALAEVEGTVTKVNPDAVKPALGWIVKNQLPNGSWPTGMGRNMGAILATTSYCGLALMASGQGYKEEVDLAAEFVRARLFEPLRVPQPNLDQSNWQIGIGGLFLCEYYAARSQDPAFDGKKFKEAIEQAVEEAFKRMEPSGGWGHMPTLKNPLNYLELEIVGNWMLSMLGAAQQLGIKPPPDKLNLALQFVQDCCQPGRGDVGYSPRGGQKGMVCACRTGGAIFAFGTLGLEKHKLYPSMVKAWRLCRAKSAEGHGSLAMGVLGSALGAKQIGNEEWRYFKTTFYPKLQQAANPDGSFKHITGTSPQAQNGSDHLLGPTYNTGIYALVLQLDLGNLKFMGKEIKN